MGSAVQIPPILLITQAQQRATDAEARKDIPALVAALNDEADGYLQLHEFDSAEKLRLRVVQLEETHAGRNSLPVADALLNLGWFYNDLARYEQAQEALDRCLEIRQQLTGMESAPVAEAYNALAALEENRSNFTLAEAFYDEAITIREKVLGPQNLDTATTWNNLATLYWITGDYAQAQTYFSQALAVREKVLGPGSLEVAMTLDNLGLLDSSLGDYDEAESYFQRVLRIRTARLPADHPAIVATLGQLGLLYVLEGDDIRAEPLLERAVQAQQKTYRIDHPDVARSFHELGMLYLRRKLYAQAEPLLVQALDIRRRILGPEDPELAASLAALAHLDHAQGRLAEAEPLYEQALKIDEDTLGKDHPETLTVATGLACLQLDMGRQAEADALARDVAEAQQDMLNGVFAFAPERQRINFEKTIEPCDLPAALGDADLISQVVLRTKGVVLDSLLEDEAMTRAARDPEVRKLMEERRLLAAQLLQQDNAFEGGITPDATSERQKIDKEEQDLEASLAEKGISSGKTRRALATDVSDVYDAIPSDAALVEYVAYNRYLGHLVYEPGYGALVLTHKGFCQWIPLGSAAEIDAKLRLYQKYVRRRVHETTLANLLQSLWQSTCQPVLAALPGDVHRLVISPDGELDFVSFATLLDPQGRFFGDDFELEYVSSGRDLLRRQTRPPRSRELVIFADPNYGRSSGDGDFFSPLPGTEREAAFLLKQAAGWGLGARLYRGAEASEANLSQQNSPYILHLATHGIYLSEEEVPRLPSGSEENMPLAGQPMSRSLLALAGASLTMQKWKQGVFPPAENDGLLTARKVAALNLDQTWLVVLSACDSGSGEVSAGEGVLGLRRGFTEAGAQNLLMTLWTVEDATTADFMEAFYREVLRTNDPPGALARVQRANLDSIRQKSGLFEAVREAGPFLLNY
ncbi:MAG TPA: CHAT domain-containing tetratricopeptide repeat protein [Candidatus Methylacidiphilales bacterium]|nr:CHAT domain-containing tetratricopeptide repeat protein [Candidatus Methylacidiphilales bacterium]